MTETKTSGLSGLPSGYEGASLAYDRVQIGPDVLPWVKEPYEITVSKCELQGGVSFLVASAIGSSQRLTSAARAMTYAQRRITDNMFYSRIPAIVNSGHSPNVETMASSTTDFPIHILRNKGGQRVYFAQVRLGLPEEEELGPTILRLAACDKNKQSVVSTVLSGLSKGRMQQLKGRN